MSVSNPRWRLIACGVAVLLSGCKQVPMLPGLTPYHMQIQQGNVVTQEMVAKLKPGMTRQQVRFVMGTPPIADAFHTDRWDYVYYLNRGGRLIEHRRLVLLFEGDTLKRIEGDVVPLAAAGAPSQGVEQKDKARSDTPKDSAADAKDRAAGNDAKVPDAKVPGDGNDGASEAKDSGSVGEAKETTAASGANADKAAAEEKGFFGRLLDKIGL